MSIKEQVVHELDRLDDIALQQVAEYVSFLKFHARNRCVPDLDEDAVVKLYSEFAEEDRQLAETGMQDYALGLAAEDAR